MAESLPIADPSALDLAAAALGRGGLVVIPTETFYGVAARIDRPDALERLSKLKSRPPGSPFPLLVSGLEGPGGLAAVAREVSEAARDLIRRFWPGPLTLVLPGRSYLPPELLGPGGTVGARRSPNPIVSALLERVRVPITATSANLRGAPAPMVIDGLPAPILAAVDLVLDAGPLPGGAPSTVLEPREDGPPRILREGKIPAIAFQMKNSPGLDSLHRGRLPFLQLRRGLRVNLDPVLLAGFLAELRLHREGLVVDLGTGNGIVPLLMASMGHRGPFLGVEIQADLASLAEANAIMNGLDTFRVIHGDLTTLTLGHEAFSGLPRVSMVVSNPPHNPLTRGRPSPDAVRALASHEVACTLAQLLDTAAGLLREGGLLAMIHRADREPEISEGLLARGFALETLVRVRPNPGADPTRLLVLAEKVTQGHRSAARSRPVEDELVVRLQDGAYSPTVKTWLDGPTET